MHSYVALILLVVGTASSLPRTLDVAMMNLAVSDSDVKSWHNALKNHDYKQVGVLNTKLEEDIASLMKANEKLDKDKVDKSLDPLKELVLIQLEKVIFKIQGILGQNEQLTLGGLMKQIHSNHESDEKPVKKPLMKKLANIKKFERLLKEAGRL